VKREIRIFFTAMMFLTRLPVPRFTDHSPEYLEKSSKYFPLIGWMVGAISVLVLLVVRYFISPELAVLLSIVAGLLVTGAFHEDGFADVCDAFGGGWTKEKILDIMKDSRLGTYGVAGLVLMLATKFLLLRQLSALTGPMELMPVFAAQVLAAHSLSRLMAVGLIQTSVYAYEGEKSKSKPLSSQKLSPVETIVAFFFGLLPLAFMPLRFALCLLPMLVAVWWLRRWYHKWIGGYTGDCLGAVQQVTEVVCYLSFIILWKFT
jgi:adenosylcobinamide-GDP ribazoletransferase